MSIQVLAPGLLTTVQDQGREGWRHLGIARCGALDPVAATLANRLVGNAENAAVLEITLQGPTLQLQEPVRIALCGAMAAMQFETTTGERYSINGGRPVELPAGILRVGTLHGSAHSWLAFAGGIDVPCVLGSRSTDLRGGFGGFDGRALRTGDTLRLLDPPLLECEWPRMPGWWIDPTAEAHTAPFRYVPSAHPAAARLADHAWQASARSNRQGLRLEGEAIAVTGDEEISAAVAPGTIQLPPDGHPIVLLADAQTVGGYPRLGHVIAADLPRLAQLRPGEILRFEPCDPQTATRLACAARARVARISLMIHQQFDRGNLG
jgi:5-oxoprolinase (ATP-hydrolysing) subunit C